MNIERFYKSDNYRSQIIKRNVIAGFGIKGISIIATLLLVPLTINYISSELYGIWLTLSSIIQWISFFDIGFGNGLKNKLAESISKNDYKCGRIYVSSTYAIMILIFLFIGIVSYFVADYVNWSSLLKVAQSYNPILIKTSQILLVALCLQMILKLIQSVIQAFQLNAIASLLDALGNVLSLIFIYSLTLTMAPNLSMIAIVFSLSPILVLLCTSLYLYSGKFRKVSPNIKLVNFCVAKDVFKLGGIFFLLQVATIVLYQMVNIIISRICGPEQVTNYNVSYKYLSILLMVITIIMTPMWTAFTDAYVKLDFQWMSKVYSKLVRFFYMATICMIFMVAMSPVVYKYWVGENVTISIFTSILVGLYVLVLIWGHIHSYLLNGIGKIRLQLYIAVFSMVCFLPVAFFLGKVWSMNGILTAMILINIPSCVFNAVQMNLLLSNRANGIWNK